MEGGLEQGRCVSVRMQEDPSGAIEGDRLEQTADWRPKWRLLGEGPGREDQA